MLGNRSGDVHSGPCSGHCTHTSGILILKGNSQGESMFILFSGGGGEDSISVAN